MFLHMQKYSAHKTYSFAYAKYIVLQMYMVLHAAPIQTRARIDEISSIQRALNILKRVLYHVTSSRPGGGPEAICLNLNFRSNFP